MSANKKFKKLSEPEKRVMIAKDVIKQIIKGRYLPKTGNYVDFGYSIFDVVNNDDDIQKNFKKIKECEVCALGSAILSCTRFTNKLKFSDFENGEEKEFKKILKIFGDKQLVLIECAFEGFNAYDEDGGIPSGKASDWGVKLTKRENKKTLRYREKYPDTSTRIIKIMENIIENNGEFIP